MHHEDGRGRKKFQEVIPVAYSVHAVAINRVKIEFLGHLEAVNGKRCPRHGTCPEGHDVRTFPHPFKAAEIAQEHIEVGQEMMAESNGLRPLQMGVPGHKRILVFICHH